jgi:hypothetical protein
MPRPYIDTHNKIVQPVVKFKNWQYSTELPIIIYADFEAALVDVQRPPNDPYRSSTTTVQQHEVMSYCFFVQTTLTPEKMVGVPLEPHIYRWENAAARFLTHLEEVSQTVKKIYKEIVPMDLTPQEEEEAYQEATQCYFCSGPFTILDHKVRAHCHFTGTFRGPAHNSCNLNAKCPCFIPILFHNLSGYDSHFIVKKLGNSPGSIHVIPNSEEKFIAFSKVPTDGVRLQFIDTYRFMSSSCWQKIWPKIMMATNIMISFLTLENFSLTPIIKSFCLKKVCFVMTMRVMSKNMIQKNYHPKKGFTVNCMMNQLVTKNINMPKLYGKHLSAKILENIVTCI